MPASKPPSEILRLKLGLHRKLFSFIRVSRTENEIIAFIVDSLWEHFPDCRVSYSEVGDDPWVKIVYTRQAKGRPPLSCQIISIREAPEYHRAVRSGKVMVVEDALAHPCFSSRGGAKMAQDVGFLSRIDSPVKEEDGRTSVLALTCGRVRNWSKEEVELVSEMAELILLFSREARVLHALKDSESIFRQFAENIDAVFWMSDPENKESIYVSPAYDRVWGYQREELKTDARAFLKAIYPGDRARVLESMKEHHRGPFEKRYRIVRPDGSVRWIKDRSFPIRDESDLVYRVVGIAEDITPLREAQERLESSQIQVASNAKLAALGEMASGIAHEINNPLAVILGVSSQLQEQLRDTGHQQTLLQGLATIDKMSKRIATIIKGLRTFSRQTDSDPMVPADFLMVLQETLAICDSGLRAANTRVEASMPSAGLMIRCRPSEISQVLLNLVNNARDAVSRSEERVIFLGLKQEADFIVFCVEDTGPGVPEDIRAKIFQPFFTTKEVGSGTGLGLSISKSIVEAHGGRLYLDSSSVRTKFVVTLPAEPK